MSHLERTAERLAEDLSELRAEAGYGSFTSSGDYQQAEWFMSMLATEFDSEDSGRLREDDEERATDMLFGWFTQAGAEMATTRMYAESFADTLK